MGILARFNPEEVHENVTEELWQYVHERDNGLCQVCGGAGAEKHHIIYRSKVGGLHKANNLVNLCTKCHHIEHSVKSKPRKYYEKRVKRNEIKLRENLV